MNTIIPKVQKWQLNEFLTALHPETIMEMWMRLCDYHKYDYQPFDWGELEKMIFAHPHLVGIELTDYESDQNLTSCVISEMIESYYGDDIAEYFDDDNTNTNNTNHQNNDDDYADDFDGVDLDMLYYEQTR